MGSSEFSMGVSAISEGHFGGGGQSYFAEMKKKAVNPDAHHQQHQREDSEAGSETDGELQEEEMGSESVGPKLELVVNEDFEPTYDIAKKPEAHAHVGRLLDVRL